MLELTGLLYVKVQGFLVFYVSLIIFYYFN